MTEKFFWVELPLIKNHYFSFNQIGVAIVIASFTYFVVNGKGTDPGATCTQTPIEWLPNIPH